MYGYPVSLKAFASVLLVHILIYIVEDVSMYGYPVSLKAFASVSSYIDIYIVADVSMYGYPVSLKAFASVLLVHTLIYISWRM